MSYNQKLKYLAQIRKKVVPVVAGSLENSPEDYGLSKSRYFDLPYRVVESSMDDDLAIANAPHFVHPPYRLQETNFI